MNEELRIVVMNMNHTVKQSEVYDQYNNTLKVLNSDVKAGLKNALDLTNIDNLSLSDLPEFGTFNRVSEIKAKDIKSLITGISKIVDMMEKQSNDVNGLIKDSLPEYISRDIITVKQATIVNIVNNYNSVALYTLDFLLYLVTLSDVKINKVDNSMVKPKIQEIRVNMLMFAKILKFFKDTKHIAKDVAKLSEDKVLIDAKDGGTLNALSISGNKMKLSGFIGNPLYHVKMWLVDREMRKYENLKEKKKLLELKILDLKARSAGESNPKLEKAIQYYEDNLAATEYKMRKIEEE